MLTLGKLGAAAKAHKQLREPGIPMMAHSSATELDVMHLGPALLSKRGNSR